MTSHQLHSPENRATPRRGPRVFITGASSGLGAALAAHYAAQGAQLGLLGRRSDALAEVVATITTKLAHENLTSSPSQQLAATTIFEAVTYVADVADAAAVSAAAQDFIARFGPPDIVIANAGVSVGTLTEYAEDLDAFKRVMQTNVFGMVATFQPFIASMQAAGGGKLVGIASVAGVRGLPGASSYSASKAAVISYLESLRIELWSKGIRVITVLPGYIVTPMTAVNTYAMPFILPADVAARRIARVIEKGSRFAVVPWQMAIVARVMRLLPNPIYDFILSRAGRKPRGLKL